jgi:hypothetical protein
MSRPGLLVECIDANTGIENGKIYEIINYRNGQCDVLLSLKDFLSNSIVHCGGEFFSRRFKVFLPESD